MRGKVMSEAQSSSLDVLRRRGRTDAEADVPAPFQEVIAATLPTPSAKLSGRFKRFPPS